jgi:hypothetical protein
MRPALRGPGTAPAAAAARRPGGRLGRLAATACLVMRTASCCSLPPSRSTAFSRIGSHPVALSTRYAAGSDTRRARLHSALAAVGFGEIDALLTSPEFRGSPALRMYSSFVLPRSDGALAAAEQPQRAGVIVRASAGRPRACH